MSGEADPQYWRERAMTARAKADQIKHRRSKRRMLGFAEGYERVAERIEQRLRAAKESK
jgi:predicted secreted protein